LGYLIESKGATKIMLHVERVPWFVSDVMNDVARPIQGFAKGTIYDGIDLADDEEVSQACRYWQNYMDSSKMEFKDEPL